MLKGSILPESTLHVHNRKITNKEHYYVCFGSIYYNKRNTVADTFLIVCLEKSLKQYIFVIFNVEKKMKKTRIG